MRRWSLAAVAMCCLFVGRAAWAEATNTVEVNFWPPPGSYSNFVGVMLMAGQGHPRYTLDGTDPEAGSVGYWDPILLTQDTTIKSAAFKGAERVSEIASRRYEIVTNGVFSSELPVVIVNTMGRSIRTRDRVPAWISVLGSEDGRSGLDGPVEYSGRGAIAVRGSSSRGMPKKPYRLELQDELGNDLKVPLLGMPKESDWILLASYTDRTFVRDPLAYELWRQMGHYAPRSRFVELFVVETNRPSSLLEPVDYRGIYLLVEKIKRGKSRVAIQKLTPEQDAEPEITGGYIFKKDRSTPGEIGLKTTRLGLEFVLEEPKERHISQAQRDWLTGYLDRFEESLFSPDFRDPKNGYRAFIEPSSFIDYHWMTEIASNPDGYGFSIVFHKDRNGKLIMGPIWDSDLCFGNLISHGLFHADGWQWERMKYPLYQWYDRLFEDPDFLQEFIDRWHHLREGPLATGNVFRTIDALAKQVSANQGRNFQRWPTLNGAVHANQILGDTYPAQVQALKQWLKARLNWIDGQCFPPPKIQLTSRGSRFELACSTGVGFVYFTTDGSDPRVAGGQPSDKAIQYDVPAGVNAGDHIVARTRSPFNLWSAPVQLSCATQDE